MTGAVRQGRARRVRANWTLPDAWEAPHHVEVAVAVLNGDRVATVGGKRLTFWPLTPEALHDDLWAAGLTPLSSTFAPEVDRYLVTAVRPTDAST